MVRLIVMPANCKLLFPRMDVRQREEGCKRRESSFSNNQIKVPKPKSNRTFCFFLKIQQSMIVHWVLPASAWLWAYVWKCLCVGVGEQLQLWKWSCLQGQLRPIGNRQDSSHTVAWAKSITQTMPALLCQHYCASTFIQILLLFSWLSSIFVPKCLECAVRKAGATGQEAHAWPH